MTQLRTSLFSQNQKQLTPGGVPGLVSPSVPTVQPGVFSPQFLDEIQRQALATVPRTETKTVQEEDGRLTEFGKAIRRGFLNLSADAKFVGAMLVNLIGAQGARDFLIKSALSSREDAQSKRLRARISSVTDIQSFADAGSFILSSIAEQFPNILLIFGSGGFAGVTAKAFAKSIAIKQARKGVSTRAVRRGLLELAEKTGQIAGATAVAVGMETGTIGIDIKQLTGKFRPGVALSFGTIAGAIDVLPFTRLFKTLGVLKKAKGSIIADLAKRGVLKSFIKGGVTQFFYEGSTEAVQTLIENSALKFVDKNHTIFKGHELELLNAFTVGGIVGFAVGGAVGGAQTLTARSLQKTRVIQGIANTEVNGPLRETTLTTGQVVEETKLRRAERARGFEGLEPQDMNFLPKNKEGETVLELMGLHEVKEGTEQVSTEGRFTIRSKKGREVGQGRKLGKKGVQIVRATALDGTPDRIMRITFPKEFTNEQKFAFLFYKKQTDKLAETGVSRVSRADQLDLRIRLFGEGLVASDISLDDSPHIIRQLPKHESLLLSNELEVAREAIKKKQSTRKILEFYQDEPLLTKEVVTAREQDSIPKFPNDKVIEGIGTKSLFWTRFTQTAPNFLRKLAPRTGDALATRLESMGRNTRQKMLRSRKVHVKSFGKLNKKERHTAHRVLRGVEVTESAKINQAVREAKSEREFMFRLAQKSQWMQRTPELVFLGKRNDTWAALRGQEMPEGVDRMLTREARRQLHEGKGPLFEEMVELTRRRLTGKKGGPMTSREAQLALLTQYGADGNVEFVPFERKLLYDLPDKFFESDIQSYFDNFSAQFWRRYYELANFGYTSVKGKPIRDVVGNEVPIASLLKDIEGETNRKVRNIANDLYDEVVGRLKRSELMGKLETHFLRPMRLFNVVRLLGLSPRSVVIQFTQITSAVAKFGSWNFISSVYRLTSGAIRQNENFKLIIESGAVDPSTLDRLVLGEGGSTKVQRALEKIATGIYGRLGVLTPFKMGDQAGRLIGAQQGIVAAEGMLKTLVTGKIPVLDKFNIGRLFSSKAQIQQWNREALAELGITDLKPALQRGKFTKKELSTIAQVSADMLFFQTGPTDLPLGWSGNPLLRTVFQFYTFAWKQARLSTDFITKEAIGRNNPMPLIRLIIGSQLAGQAVVGLMRGFEGDERLEPTKFRQFWNNFMYVGTWGLIMDAFTADFSKLRLGPTGDLVTTFAIELGQVIKAANGDIFKQLSESSKRLLVSEVTVLRVLNRKGRTEKRREFDNFVGKIATSKKQAQATGITAELGVRPTRGQRSVLWEAASEAAMGKDSYSKFELAMRKRIRSSGTIKGVIEGLIRSQAPAELYTGMDRFQRGIFDERFGSPRERGTMREQLMEASTFHLLASMQASTYFRRFVRENLDFVREELKRRGKNQ